MPRKYAIYFAILILLGICIAIFGSPLGLLVYGISSFIFTVFLFLMLRFRRPIAKQALNKAVNMAASHVHKSSRTEEDDPSILVQYGSEGVRGMEVNFNGNAPGQPGAGPYNPAATLDRAVDLDLATQIALIMNSNASEAAKKQALNLIEERRRQRNNPQSNESQHVQQRTRLPVGNNPYSSTDEGNYSLY